MNLQLIIAIIQQIVVPEIADIIQKRQAAGQTITDAEIMAELSKRVTDVVAQGVAWLDAHPA